MRKRYLYITIAVMSSALLLSACSNSKESNKQENQIASEEKETAIGDSEIGIVTENDESEIIEEDKSETIEENESESEKTESDKSESVNSESKEPTSSETKKPESSETKEPESSETKKPESSESKEPTSSETKKPESSETKKPESSESKEPEKEPEKAPTKPSTPNGPTFTGGNITLGNIGITVPTLNEFNKAGLDKDNFWYADDNTLQVFADNGNAIMSATGVGVAGSDGNGFTIFENQLDWAYASWGATNSITLKRDCDNKYFVLEINVPLDKDESVLFGGKDMAPISRDIVKFMISSFSSTPETVYNAVYDSIYGDDNLPIPLNSWGNVGDCKAYIDYESCYSGHFVFRFKAK